MFAVHPAVGAAACRPHHFKHHHAKKDAEAKEAEKEAAEAREHADVNKHVRRQQEVDAAAEASK